MKLIQVRGRHSYADAATLSDRALGLIAIEQERKILWQQAQEVSAKQMHAIAQLSGDMLRMSGEHAAILTKMAALDEAAERIIKCENL